jgi:hypothetical protein
VGWQKVDPVPHANFPIIRERRGDIGKPGFVLDHGFGSAGVRYHARDCEESVKSKICDELGAMLMLVLLVLRMARGLVEKQDQLVESFLPCP